MLSVSLLSDCSAKRLLLLACAFLAILGDGIGGGGKGIDGGLVRFWDEEIDALLLPYGRFATELLAMLTQLTPF